MHTPPQCTHICLIVHTHAHIHTPEYTDMHTHMHPTVHTDAHTYTPQCTHMRYHTYPTVHTHASAHRCTHIPHSAHNALLHIPHSAHTCTLTIMSNHSSNSSESLVCSEKGHKNVCVFSFLLYRSVNLACVLDSLISI